MTRQISDEALKDLRDQRFGGCTTVCECMEISELREQLDRDGGDLELFVKGLLEGEGIWWERCHDARAAGGVENDLDEHGQWMTEVKGRVLAWLEEYRS